MRSDGIVDTHPVLCLLVELLEIINQVPLLPEFIDCSLDGFLDSAIHPGTLDIGKVVGDLFLDTEIMKLS